MSQTSQRFAWALGLTLGLSLGGCATVPPTLPALPVLKPDAPATALPIEVSPRGLKVTSDPTAPGQFMAGLLFRGGPINDPPSLPGLTEWVAEAALLGTVGRDSATEGPHQRALALGGSIESVATGALVGWLVSGPAESADGLTDLLFEVALRPSFPASRTSMAITRNRDSLDTQGDAVVERAIAIALGQAVGLGRPLYMGPTKGMFERVTLAHTERHWRTIVQPEVGVLVVLGASAPTIGTLTELERIWPDAPSKRAEAPKLCTPQGRSAHLMVTPGSFGEHTIALWGGRAPGLGESGRRVAQAVMIHLDSRAGGPVEALVGAAQARRSSPDIIDLGHIEGRPIAAALVGAAGPPERALADLDRVDRFLSGIGPAQGVKPEQAQEAERRMQGQAQLRRHRPFHGVLQRAIEALGGADGQQASAEAMNAAATELFAPWRSSLVLVGSMDLRNALEERAKVAVWSEEEESRPPETLIRCVSEGAPR